ncbi:MAG: hypothetical protein RIQ56_680 [Candidatus Parcubacteria bacterium]
MEQVFSAQIQKAVRFAIRTHEGYQKQKRKGKDLPYITHPLLVGMLLSRTGASEDVIIAGVLHDTIEDSPPHKKVTRELLEERFGVLVANIVDSVSEPSGESWAVRKAQALEKIATYARESVLVKSADVVSNLSETIADFEKEGDIIFTRFNAPKEMFLAHYERVMEALLRRMTDNPFRTDFDSIREAIKRM